MKTKPYYTKQINCLIVDDEPIARQGIGEYLSHLDEFKIVASCKNAIEATSVLQAEHIDLIFLDIHMPHISGIDFLKNLKNPPLVIMTTAYPEYAVEGFNLDICDYLLKPISYARFLKAVTKAYEILSYNERSKIEKIDFFFIKSGQNIEKIFLDDILYIKSHANYVIIYTQEKRYITYLTFKSIEDRLPADKFIKTHRSYLVALKAIQTITANDLIVNENEIPISKTYKDSVIEMVERFLFKRD